MTKIAAKHACFGPWTSPVPKIFCFALTSSTWYVNMFSTIHVFLLMFRGTLDPTLPRTPGGHRPKGTSAVCHPQRMSHRIFTRTHKATALCAYLRNPQTPHTLTPRAFIITNQTTQFKRGQGPREQIRRLPLERTAADDRLRQLRRGGKEGCHAFPFHRALHACSYRHRHTYTHIERPRERDDA